MQFADELLMAYTDGEVDADTRRRIEAAATLDPALAERIDQHCRLRAEVSVAFDGVLPTRLLYPAGAFASAAHPARFIDIVALRAARYRQENTRRWSWLEWTAIAASMIVGIFAGQSAVQPEPSSPLVLRDDHLIARGNLATALSEQLGGPTNAGSISIGPSFHAKSGSFCRTFVTHTTAGLACKEADVWKVRAMSEGVSKTSGGEHRMAGWAASPTVRDAVENLIDGKALNRAEEEAARSRGWKK